MRDLAVDARHAIRLFRRTPVITSIAILSLAITIGIGAVVFTALKAVIIDPLPYRRSSDLVVLSSTGRSNHWVSWSDMQDVVRRNRSFESIGVYHYALLNVRGDTTHTPEALYGLWVSASLFPTLGVAPMIGRNILPEEDQPGRNHEIILSYGVWKHRFNSDPNITGRSIPANGYVFRVIGVMPPGFDFPLRAATTVRKNSPYMEFWAPMGQDPAADQRRNTSCAAVGRLRANVTREQAAQELTSIGHALAREYPVVDKDRRIEAFSLDRETIGEARPALLILMAAAALFMLIGCANVANLLLSRSVVRQSEIAVRLALGASRRRIVRQLMTESSVLALAGGLSAYALTAAAWSALPALLPQSIPRLIAAGVDWRIFLFALAVAIVNGLVFGPIPAVRTASSDPAAGLRDSGLRGTQGAASKRLQSTIVAAEIAITVVLVVAGVQLASSFVRLMRNNPGFEPNGVLASIIVPQGPAYIGKPEHWGAFYRRVLDRAGTLPGVESAGTVDALPFSGQNNGAYIHTADSPSADTTPENAAEYDNVSSGYLQTIGVRLLQGRWFRPDDEENPGVVIIDETAARRYFAGRHPIGQRLCVNCLPGRPADWKQVVGVVNSIRHYSLAAPADPEVYVADNALRNAQFLVLRVSGRPSDVIGPLRRMVAGIDPDVPIYLSAEMSSLIGDSVEDRRFVMAMLAITSALALVLAAAGVYGVLSYAISRRTREIGIRVALGATAAQVRALVMRQGLTMAAAGLAIGIPAAIVATRLLGGTIAGLSSADPMAILIAAAVVSAIAMFACLIPARRAARVDPIAALHHE